MSIFSQNTDHMVKYHLPKEENVYTHVTEACYDNIRSIYLAGMAVSQEAIRGLYYGEKTGDEVIVQESIQGIKNGARGFFRKVANMIKALFKRMIMMFDKHALTMDRFIQKYRSELDDMNPNFTITGYTYTVPNDVPNIEPVHKLVSDYNTELLAIHNQNKGDIVEAYTKRFGTGDAYNQLRAVILNQQLAIPEEDFSDEVFKLLRAGSDMEQTIMITKVQFMTAIKTFKAHKERVATFRKERDRMLTLIHSIERFFETSYDSRYDDGVRVVRARNIDIEDGRMVQRNSHETYQVGKDTALAAFYTHKWTEANALANMLTTVLNMKMDALDKSLKQDKLIIMEGIKKANQVGGED